MDRSSHQLTIVSAADSAFFRSLLQLLASLARHVEAGAARYVVYDLGLKPAERRRIAAAFPSVELRQFDFDAYPDFVRNRDRSVNTFAWKPLIIQTIMGESAGCVLWLDSSTVVCASLDPVVEWTRRTGLYTPLGGRSTIGERTHPATLEALGADAFVRARRQRVGGICCFDATQSRIRRLVHEWSDACLDPGVGAPPGATRANHRFDQSVLNILLARDSALELTTDEIDISSNRPTPIFRARNKLPSWMPIWLDALPRAWFALYRTIDVGLWKLKGRL